MVREAVVGTETFAYRGCGISIGCPHTPGRPMPPSVPRRHFRTLPQRQTPQISAMCGRPESRRSGTCVATSPFGGRDTGSSLLTRPGAGAVWVCEDCQHKLMRQVNDAGTPGD